jgi:hypothetical protein
VSTACTLERRTRQPASGGILGPSQRVRRRKNTKEKFNTSKDALVHDRGNDRLKLRTRIPKLKTDKERTVAACTDRGRESGKGRDAIRRVIRRVVHPRVDRVGHHLVGRVWRQESLERFYIAHGRIEPHGVGVGRQDHGRIVDDPRRRSGNSTAVTFSAGRVALSWPGEGVP